MSRTPVWLTLTALAAGCNRDKEGTPLPAAGTLEPVSLLWEGAEFAGSHPSVIRFDDAWHMYLTASEGSLVGTMHATSTDGVNFSLVSSHRLLDDLVASADTTVRSAAAFTSDTRAHLLVSTESAGASEVHHATSTDASEFTLDGGPVFTSVLPATVEASGAFFDAASVTALLVEDDGSGDARAVERATSDDGGTTFSTPALALQPDDLPTPWGSSTVGAGGMWGAVLVGQDDGSYNMLYLGAAPNGDEALGIGQAWSGDGEVWSSDGELWYEPEAGQIINGLSLVSWEGGYELWVGLSASGEDPLESGAFYHMRFE